MKYTILRLDFIHPLSENPKTTCPMKKTIFKFKDTDELLSSNSGLALTGLLLDRTELAGRISATDLPAAPNPIIPHDDVIQSMIGLLTLGKTHYDDIEPFREDPFFKESLHLTSVPSCSTLRQRLDDVSDAFNDIIKEESAQLLKNTIEPTPIVFHTRSFIPLDIDVKDLVQKTTCQFICS
jgi:hypothetical protein